MKFQIKLNLINNTLYLTYARKSLEDKKRQVRSIPEQLRIDKRLADTKFNIVVPKEYIFIDTKSAKFHDNRPNFTKMIGLVEYALSKGIKVRIICWLASRLARNGKEGGILEDFVRWKGLEIYTNYGNYLAGDEDKLHNEFGHDAKHSKDTSLGVLRNMESKVERSICPTAAHLGYRFDPKKEQGDKDVVKGPNWDKCREWVIMMLSGQYTVEQSLAKMTANGLYANKKKDRTLSPVSPSKAYAFFKDIYNTGLFLFHGEVHQGTHPPLMTMKEYQKLQTIIQDRGGKKGDLKGLPYMGIFTCSFCKGKITAERHLRKYKNGKEKLFCYYRCSRRGPKIKDLGECKEEGLTEIEMNNQIKSYLNDIEVVPEFLEWLKKVIRRQNQIEYHTLSKEQELQTKRLKEITRQKFELRAMKNEGFFPDEQEYLKEKEALLKQEQIVKQDIVVTDDSHWDALFEDLCTFMSKLRELYDSEDPVIQKMLVKIIGLNFKLEDKKLKIEAKSAFIAMERVKKELWEKNLWIEPQNKPILASKQAHSDQSIFYGADERI